MVTQITKKLRNIFVKLFFNSDLGYSNLFLKYPGKTKGVIISFCAVIRLFIKIILWDSVSSHKITDFPFLWIFKRLENLLFLTNAVLVFPVVRRRNKLRVQPYVRLVWNFVSYYSKFKFKFNFKLVSILVLSLKIEL